MKNLFCFLAIALIGSIVFFLPSCQPAEPQTAQVEDVLMRSRVGSALKRTVSRIQRETGEWPESLSELRSAPEIAPYATYLQDASYDLVKIDGTNATFRFRLGTREWQVIVGEARESQGVPSLSGPTPMGG